MFSISEVDKSDSGLLWLVSELDAFQNALYPAESNHCLDLSTVTDEQLSALSYVMKVAYLQVVVLCYFIKMAQLRLSGFIFDRNIGVGSSENR